MLIDRKTRRLHQENIRAANVLQQLKMYLAVGESLQPGLAQRHSNELADLLAQRAIGRSAKNLEALLFTQLAGALPLRCRPLACPPLSACSLVQTESLFPISSACPEIGERTAVVSCSLTLKPSRLVDLGSSCCLCLRGLVATPYVSCTSSLRILQKIYKTSVLLTSES